MSIEDKLNQTWETLQSVKRSLKRAETKQQKYINYLLTLCTCNQGENLNLGETEYVYCDHCEFLISMGDMQRKDV